MNVDTVRHKLLDGDTDVIYRELLEIYRHIEILHTDKLGQILETLLPVWSNLLKERLPPQFADTPLHRCRKLLLQIINRLPSNDRMRPYVSHLLHVLMDVLLKDNEENSLSALKTIFDLHRNFRPGLREEVQPFLELVQQIYLNFEQTMRRQFTHTLPETTTKMESTPSKLASDVRVTIERDEVTSSMHTVRSFTEGISYTGEQDQQSITKGQEVIKQEQGNVGTSIRKSMESFKTIAELPLIIMLLFQCYPNYIEGYIPVLVPLMMSAITLRPPDNSAKESLNLYHDFLDAQVKTLSFLTYLLRGCTGLMRPYQDTICENAVKLLSACPDDALLLRKDIFVAARHIISTEFRKGFYPQLDILMNDDILIGKSRSGSSQILPLAYSTLADMIHHVRDMLTLPQVGKIVDFYGKRISDIGLPISIQTTSIRLLLNLVDICAKSMDGDGWYGRNILSRILLIISAKFKSVLHILPQAILNDMQKVSDGSSELYDNGAMEILRTSSLVTHHQKERSAYETKLLALLSPYKVQHENDMLFIEEPTLCDVKSLLKTMILGVRAVVWCAANYRTSEGKEGADVETSNLVDNLAALSSIESRGNSSYYTDQPATLKAQIDKELDSTSLALTDDERALIERVFQNGLRCFLLYTFSDSSLAEEKQILDHFAGAFTVLHATDFCDLFISNVSRLHDCILQDHAILTIPQHFLANANVSCWFAEILLNHLVEKMDELAVEAEPNLSDADRKEKVLEAKSIQFEQMRYISPVQRASIIVRLFKIVFGSVTLYKSNEAALFPHLRVIIKTCLRNATKTKYPDNYLLLLRALFRSISGGKYENFYKEALPILPEILYAIMRLQENIQNPLLQEVLLELCLTIPARLSSLLQYLPILMRSVIKAILAEGELAYLGLRTLEFWVDNLNPDFLYPIMTSQDRLLTEIIESLKTHLLPDSYPHGELALRILGKLGGKNRQYLQDDRVFHAMDISYTKPDCSIYLKWRHSSDHILRLDIQEPIQSASKILRRYFRKSTQQWKIAGGCDLIFTDVESEAQENVAQNATCDDDIIEKFDTESIRMITSTILFQKRQAFNLIRQITSTYFVLDTDCDLGTVRGRVCKSSSFCHKLLLVSIIEAVADIDLGVAAQELLSEVCSAFIHAAIKEAYRGPVEMHVLQDISHLEISSTERLTKIVEDLTSQNRFVLWRKAAYGASKFHEADSMLHGFKMLVEAIVSTIGSSKKEIMNVAINTLKQCMEIGARKFSSMTIFTQEAGAIANYISEVLCHSCFNRADWRKSLAGATGLKCLIESLDARWCHENELSIIRSFFFVLANHPIEVTATIQAEIGHALLTVVDKAWEARRNTSTSPDTFQKCLLLQDKELLQICVSELLGSHTASRTYARKCIEEISHLSKTSVSSMLHPYCQYIMNQAGRCHFHAFSVQKTTGCIDALAYILTLKPPILAVTEDLMGLLKDLWQLVSDESSTAASVSTSWHTYQSPVSAVVDEDLHSITSSKTPSPIQEYPFGLSQQTEAKIAAIQLLQATFLAAPEDLKRHQEACNHFVGIFFRNLIDQPVDLVEAAYEALKNVIYLNKQNNDISLPKELLQQCLRPVLLNLADYRKLNLSLLDGLSRLLSLLSNCFNVTLGEKLLEHLKQWREYDRIIKSGIWKCGQEPLVAAAIVDLFHLLPPNESFLEPLVGCVIALEDVLTRFGNFGRRNSPYRPPLTRFLSKYPTSAINYFLKQENLLDQRCSSLFQHIVKLPEAGPLRMVLIGESGTEALIAATFAAATKLPFSPQLDIKGNDAAEDMKLRAQIQMNAQKAAAHAVAAAQSQGLTASVAEARGMQARAAYVAKAQAQVSAHQVLKAQSQKQIHANAQKLHAQTLSAAQAQGMSLLDAQAKAQTVSKDYITKAHNQGISANLQSVLPSYNVNSLVSQHQAQQLHVLIQANAQKVHAQTLAAAQEQGIEPSQAQEKAKQAQTTYVHQAKAQAQAKLARVHGLNPTSTQSGITSNSKTYGTKAQYDALEIYYQGLRLVRTISKLHPNWLASRSALMDCLKKHWRSSARIQRSHSLEVLPIRYHSETKLFVKCFITYCRSEPNDSQYLFEILTVFLDHTPLDFSFLRTFFQKGVQALYSPTNKRKIIRDFLGTLRDPNTQEDLKVTAIQILVTPLLTAIFDDPSIENTKIMDADTTNLMLKEILATKDQPGDTRQTLRIALLKLGTLLIQHMSKHVTDQRKEVIKVAWNHLKAPNLTSKLWAYVNVCRFIAGYETPPKIVLQVYVALLRTYDMDSRYLVRKALDILLPVLPVRLPSNELIKAIKWTKKIAYEEGHVLNQLVHIWFLIVRHPVLFYPFRGQFIPLMINSLNRLAVPPSSTPDNRRLAVNIVDLIISCEEVRRIRVKKHHNVFSTDDSVVELEGTTAKRRKIETEEHDTTLTSEVDHPIPSVDPTPVITITEKLASRLPVCEDSFELSGAMSDLISNFCLRFALASADKQETNRMSRTCGRLFQRAISLWPSPSIRFSYFDKLIAVTADAVLRQNESQANSNSDLDPTAAPAMPPFFSIPKSAPLASVAVLSAVLDILNALVIPRVITSASSMVPYVVQYAPRIMKLLEPCFEKSHAGIQSDLNQYLQRFTEVFSPASSPQQLITCGFYDWLRNIMDEKLMSLSLSNSEEQSTTGPVTKKTKKVPSQTGSHFADNTPAATTADKKVKATVSASSQNADQKDPEHAKMRSDTSPAGEAELALQILRTLAAITSSVPSFVDHFVPVLLVLMKVFMKEHILHQQSFAATARAAGTNVSETTICQEGTLYMVMATPALAITDEWERLHNGRSKLLYQNAQNTARTRGTKEDKVKKKSSTLGQQESFSVKRTADGSNVNVPNAKFGSRKSKAGCAALSAIWVKSVKVLLLCFQILSKASFASADQRRMFINLLLHCLGNSTSVPLLAFVLDVVAELLLSETRPALTSKDRSFLLARILSLDRINEVLSIPLQQKYFKLRLKLQNEVCDVVPALFSSCCTLGLLAIDLETRRAFLSRFTAKNDTDPVACLRHLVSRDWQSLGSRYWVIVAIEALLMTVDSDAAALTGASTSNDAKAHGTSKEIINALSALVHIDLKLAESIWANLFREVWSVLPKVERLQTCTSLIKLLASKFHKNCLRRSLVNRQPERPINVPKTLLHGILSCYEDVPALTPELLVYVATHHGGWFYAVKVCEFQIANTSLSVDSHLRWVEALYTLYKKLHEDDWRVGLSFENINESSTFLALFAEAKGRTHEAQDMYFELLKEAQTDTLRLETTSIFELRLWEDRWVECAKQLCQWKLMNGFAKSTQNQELLLDCAWKRGDWSGAKQLLMSPVQGLGNVRCPEIALQRLYIAILDGDRKHTIDALLTQITQLSLQQWQSMPLFLGRAHVSLLHLFHKFVELKESIQMMTDIKSASQTHAMPNLKPAINIWRERLPNKYEDILLWDDILTWRTHMYQVVKSTFSWSDAQILACMHDNPWSIIKLAHIARKQHLPDVCLGALSKLSSVPAMDVEDAFYKLREQVNICYESSTEYVGGLSILNNTNLDFFSSRQKAEMFRLKGLFLEALGESKEANKTFSHCLQICDNHGKGWLSWGNYWYNLFMIKRDTEMAAQAIACYFQAIHHRCNSARLMIARVFWLLSSDDESGTLIQAFEQYGKQLPIWIWIVWIPQLLMALERAEAPQIRGLLRGLASKFPQALYYTLRALFLEYRENAIQGMASNTEKQVSQHYGGSNSTSLRAEEQSFVSHTKNTSTAGQPVYAQSATGHIVAIPNSVPLPEALQKIGAIAPATELSAAIGSETPVISLEDWSRRYSGTSPESSKAEMVLQIEELLNFLRRSHETLVFEMECMLEELIVRFRPGPEEELLSAVHALLMKCDQLPSRLRIDDAPKMLRATLAKVCRKFFELQPNQNKKLEELIQMYKTRFERDFIYEEAHDPMNSSLGTTIPKTCPKHNEITSRLLRWKNVLEKRVTKVYTRDSGLLYTENCSNHLMETRSVSVEIPGQYISDCEPIKDLHARVHYFSSSLEILLRNGYTQRRLTIGGSDGRDSSFLIQYAMTHITRTDERVMQMYLLLNRYLRKHKQTLKRNLYFPVPKIIPLTPRVRLAKDSRDSVTLEELYRESCEERGVDPDIPIKMYWEAIDRANEAIRTKDEPSLAIEGIEEAKLRCLQEICDKHVPSTILSGHIQRITSYPDIYFYYRCEFTKFLAVSSFVSYVLYAGDRTPSRFLIYNTRGQLRSTDIRPVYSSNGIVDGKSSVSFRLTRNLTNFVTPIGIHGPMTIAVSTIADALLNEQALVRNHLSLFFRDDLVSWQISKSKVAIANSSWLGSSRTDTVRQLDAQMIPRVQVNTDHVMSRIAELSCTMGNSKSGQSYKTIKDLVDNAMDVGNQKDMYPMWAPWL